MVLNFGTADFRCPELLIICCWLQNMGVQYSYVVRVDVIGMVFYVLRMIYGDHGLDLWQKHKNTQEYVNNSQ